VVHVVISLDIVEFKGCQSYRRSVESSLVKIVIVEHNKQHHLYHYKQTHISYYQFIMIKFKIYYQKP
jgi:hypothetical protein